MTPERWQRIRGVLDDALARKAKARSEFVIEACDADSSVAADVLRFLQQYEEAEDVHFLNAGPMDDLADRQPHDAGSRGGAFDTSPVSHGTTGAFDAQIGHAARTPAPAKGVLRGNRFEIRKEYARGGLGVVFLAFDRELGRTVAIKEIQERFSDDQSARLRFTREAQITGQLEHPGVAPVYCFGEYEHGRLYYAMKLVTGQSMRQAIGELHGRSTSAGAGDEALTSRPKFASQSFRRLLSHFASLCNTIEYAHQAGCVHRDIKPANVHLGKLGETIVLDWGLAKRTSDKADELANHRSSLPDPHRSSKQQMADLLTRDGDVFGTPVYMSPEQASGEIDSLGPSSDIFSLGATLYTILVGEPPSDGKKSKPIADLLADRQAGNWIRPRERNNSIPPPIAGICDKAMALVAEDRYASASELAADVERYLANEPTTVWQESLGERFVRWQRRFPGFRFGLLMTTAVMLVGLFGLSWLALGLRTSRNDERAAKHNANRLAERAVEAERKTRLEAAQTQASNIARLAGRGDWQAVLAALDSPLLAEYDDPIRLELWRVESLEALNRASQARAVVDRLAKQQGLGSHRARVLLVQADIRRLGGEDTEQMVREAIAAGLPEADRLYAQALVAPTIPNATVLLEEVVKLKPFHRRANALLTMNLIVSGRLDEGRARAEAARALFPDDVNFPFLLTLAAAFQQDEIGVQRYTTLMTDVADEAFAAEARSTIGLFESILSGIGNEPSLAEIVGHGASWLLHATTRQSSLEFPLENGPQFRRFVGLCSQGFKNWTLGGVFPKKKTAAIASMRAAAQILPIASVQGVYGRMLYETYDFKQAAEVLDRAAHAPSLIKASRHVILHLAAVAKCEFYVHNRHTSEGKRALERGFELWEEYLDIDDPPRELLSICDIYLVRFEKTRKRIVPILERALQSHPDDDELKIMLARYHIVFGDKLRGLELTSEVLADEPDNELASKARSAAEKAIATWLSDHHFGSKDRAERE